MSGFRNLDCHWNQSDMGYVSNVARFLLTDQVIKTRLQLSASKRPSAVASPSLILPSSPSSSPLPRTIANSAAALTQSATLTSTTIPKQSSALGPAMNMTLDIFKKDGIRGLYRGLSASYLGVSEGVIQWVLYEVSGVKITRNSSC